MVFEENCPIRQPSPSGSHAVSAGALVLELLPYNWDWKGISQIYVNLTASLGDVHHTAWRATSPRWVQYAAPDDARYADWTAEECGSR